MVRAGADTGAGAKSEAGAARDVELLTGAPEEELETERAAAELRESEEEPEQVPPGRGKDVSFALVTESFWREGKSKNLTRRPQEYSLRAQGLSERPGLHEYVPWSEVSVVMLTRI